MKRLLMTITMTCALSCSAFAGEIPSVGAPAPSGTEGTTATSPVDMPTGGVSEDISSDALSALLSALSFLAV